MITYIAIYHVVKDFQFQNPLPISLLKSVHVHFAPGKIVITLEILGRISLGVLLIY